METVAVSFINKVSNKCIEIEIPLDITAKDLVTALNETYDLKIDTNNILDCYLVSENPIAFLRGNKLLSEFGIRNGTDIIYMR